LLNYRGIELATSTSNKRIRCRAESRDIKGAKCEKVLFELIGTITDDGMIVAIKCPKCKTKKYYKVKDFEEINISHLKELNLVR
jgi:phage FluMu protein Com